MMANDPSPAPDLGTAGAARTDPPKLVDPRQSAVVVERDSRALAFIGYCREVSQSQLAESVFPGRAESIVSRVVRRLENRGLLVIHRWHGSGINRLRLSRKGERLLVKRGIDEQRIFVSNRLIADAALAHHLSVVDTYVALKAQERRPSRIWPSWYLQRKASTLAVIPDLLAIWGQPSDPRLLLAVEIDRGGEAVRTVLLPKLDRLDHLLGTDWPDTAHRILVLTSGPRRVASLQEQRPALLIDLLPKSTGRAAIDETRNLLARAMS